MHFYIYIVPRRIHLVTGDISWREFRAVGWSRCFWDEHPIKKSRIFPMVVGVKGDFLK